MAASKSAAFLECFWGIASLAEEERIASIKLLIRTIHQSTEDRAELLQYTVSRLVKGTASDRKGARQGFSIALSQLVRRFPEVSPQVVLTSVDKHLQITRDLHRQEEKGCLFGQVFACLSLIQSSRMDWPESLEVMRRLMALCQRKDYLQEVCSVAVGQLLLEFREVAEAEEVLSVLSAVGEGGWEGMRGAELYLLLRLQSTFPKEPAVSQLIKSRLGHKKVLCNSTIKMAACVLRSVPNECPGVPSVWVEALEASRRSLQLLQSFWTTCVEEDLLESSDKKKALSLSLLELLLPTLTADEASVVLSPQILRSLVAAMTNQSSSLHQQAKRTIEVLLQVLQDRNSQVLSVAVVMKLQDCPRITSFDKVSRTQAVAVLLRSLNPTGRLDYLYRTVAIFSNPDTSPDCDVDSARIRALERLVTFVKATPPEEGLLLLCQHFLLAVVCRPQGWAQAWTDALPPAQAPPPALDLAGPAPLSEGVVEAGKQQLFSMLCWLMTRSKEYGYRDDPAVLIATVEAAHLMLDCPGAEWTEARQLVQTLSSSPSGLSSSPSGGGSGSLDRALAMMAAHQALLLASGPAKLAQAQLRELSALHEDVEAGQGAGPWVAVLTDVVLALLSEPTALTRKVASQAFRMTMAHQTVESLGVLANVLKPNLKEELFLAPEEDEDEEGDDEGINDGGDVNGDHDDDEDNDDDDDEDDDDEVEEEDDDDGDGSCDDEANVDEAFRLQIKNALGTAALVDEDEESLDDEEMFKLDASLAEAVRSRTQVASQRKQRKEDEKQLVHYRLRALELVEIFVRRYSSSPLVLHLAGPLARLACSNMADTRAKAGSVMDRLVKGKVPHDGVDQSLLGELQASLLALLRKVPSESTQAVTSYLLWVARVWNGLHVDPSLWTPPFQDCARDFCTKRSRGGYFTLLSELIQRFTDVGCSLLGIISESPNDSVSTYRKTQCYQLISLALKGQAQVKGHPTATATISPDLKHISQDLHKLSSELAPGKLASKGEKRLLREMLGTLDLMLQRKTQPKKAPKVLPKTLLALKNQFSEEKWLTASLDKIVTLLDVGHT